MLTLENTECKGFAKVAIKDEEISIERNSGESYEEKDKCPLANGGILRTALLSPGDDDDDEDADDIESQEDVVSSEFLPIGNDTDIGSESTISDWENLKAESPVPYVTSVPDDKEFIIIKTEVDSDNALMTKKLSNERSVSHKKHKSRHRSKRRNKVTLLRKLLPRYEPIVEIKEEDHPILSSDIDERVPTMEEFEFDESSMDQQTIADSKINGDWLQSFRSLPLDHTDRGIAYLKCPACNAMFFTSHSFQKHLYSHVYREEDSFICSFCNYTNTEPGMLFAHLSKHQEQCESCNENLMRKNKFEKHWDIQTALFTVKRDHRGRFVCSFCKLVFNVLPQLEKHWFKHACKRERTYQCQECSGLYESRETLKNHKCMKCAVCGKVYESLQRLKAHTMWAKHNLKCPICSYEFILTMDHEKHLALHRQTYHTMMDYLHCLQSADKKTFQCNLCDKLFYTLQPLILHVQEDHDIKNVKKDGMGSNGDKKTDETLAEVLLRTLKEEAAKYANKNNNVSVSKDKTELQNLL